MDGPNNVFDGSSWANSGSLKNEGRIACNENGVLSKVRTIIKREGSQTQWPAPKTKMKKGVWVLRKGLGWMGPRPLPWIIEQTAESLLQALQFMT